jgi:predicted RNase H-like nuclease (RuvC/YqgF family)
MSWNTIFRILTLLFVATCFFGLRLAAQDSPSVAEAARRAREQKQAASKPAQVVTNETLPAPANQPGEAKAPGAPAQPESSAPAPSEAMAQAENPSSQDPEQIKKQVENLKQEIADKQRVIADLQREIALEQDVVYRNPDYQHDTAGKQKLDSLQSGLKQNQDELAELKAKLTDLASAQEPKESAPAPLQP